MILKAKHLAATLALVVPLATMSIGCNNELPGGDRWATTENTNVKIDWDKVNQAYKDASGPADLEQRINEIYEGDEVISINVHDQDDKVQVVTGFFDKNTDGAVEDDEKIFTIKREVKGEDEAQYQMAGYGHYGGYTSPMYSVASGMMMGAMLSHMFMPSYRPMYTQAYATHPGRVSQIKQSRSSFRAQHPSRFQRSQSGRSYNRPTTRVKPTGRSFGGGRLGGGGRFGLARAGRNVRPRLLVA